MLIKFFIFQNSHDVKERLSNLFSEEVATKLIDQYEIKDHDLLIMGIGEKDNTRKLLGRIRVDYHDFLLDNDAIKKNYDNKFLWVIDFPMFEMNEETKELQSVHHPFTAPHEDDMDKFINATDKELFSIRSQAYDLVLNGQEIGGGSMRIHNRDMQHYVLEQILKIPHDHLAHLLQALESGCPPHGGIALGLDRLIAIICRARSIRDVIAFPKSLNGRDPLSNAPVPLSEEEKNLYHISIMESVGENANAHQQEDDDPDAVRPPPSPASGDESHDPCEDIKTEVHDNDMIVEEIKQDPPETSPAKTTETPARTKRAVKKK